MRIGIDAHILSPEHHRHHPEVAYYTRRLIQELLKHDQKNSYVLFMDSRMPRKDLEEYQKKNTEIRHFPFAQYRAYLPFVYSHLLVSSILIKARLDVFHSPEGLIPYLYPGKTIATFHWVPTGTRESNVFVKTWMLGARAGFAAFCRGADRILLRRSKDRDILCGVHHYPESRAYVIPCLDCDTVDWEKHVREVLSVYEDVLKEKSRRRPRLLRSGLPRFRSLRKRRKKS